VHRALTPNPRRRRTEARTTPERNETHRRDDLRVVHHRNENRSLVDRTEPVPPGGVFRVKTLYPELGMRMRTGPLVSLAANLHEWQG
jgi:hypothetical protein